MTADRFTWHKSSYSGGTGGQCVEVATTPEYVGIRDTKNRPQGYLTVSPKTWRAFIKDTLVTGS